MSSSFGTTPEEKILHPEFGYLAKIVEDCREIANRHGERFNIFSILGVQRDENHTHSRFLSELLNPMGRHGEGTRFLNAFLSQLPNPPNPVTGRVKVKREFATEHKRRVDIVVESSDLIVGVELKIDANDQKEQLHDYYQELERRSKGRKRVVLAYLTLNGKQPSNYSRKNLSPENIQCLSFATDIRQWLQTCCQQSGHKSELVHALMQYQRLIENLTGAGTSMKSLLANELLSNRDAMNVALDTEKALPVVKGKIMLQFWECLSVGLIDAFGEIPVVYGAGSLREISENYFNKSRDNKHVGIKLPICKLNGNTVSLYVNVYHVIHYGLRIENASGEPTSQPELKTQFRKILNDGNATADSELDWLICYYHDPATIQEPFRLNFHAFNESVLDLINEENRQAIIKSIVEHQVRLVDTIKSMPGTKEL